MHGRSSDRECSSRCKRLESDALPQVLTRGPRADSRPDRINWAFDRHGGIRASTTLSLWSLRSRRSDRRIAPSRHADQTERATLSTALLASGKARRVADARGYLAGTLARRNLCRLRARREFGR